MMNADELLALSHQTSIALGLFAGLVVTLVIAYVINGVREAEAELIEEFNKDAEKYNKEMNVPEVKAGFLKNYKAEVKGLNHD